MKNLESGKAGEAGKKKFEMLRLRNEKKEDEIFRKRLRNEITEKYEKRLETGLKIEITE